MKKRSGRVLSRSVVPATLPRTALLAGALLTAIILPGPFAGMAQDRVATGREYMVSAPTPEAVEAGRSILEAGGNAVDAAGNAVAITQSIGPGFGSKVASREMGFFYACSYDMNDDPVPFQREKTSQSPTMVLENGRPLLVLGSAGSGRIPGSRGEAIPATSGRRGGDKRFPVSSPPTNLDPLFHSFYLQPVGSPVGHHPGRWTEEVPVLMVATDLLPPLAVHQFVDLPSGPTLEDTFDPALGDNRAHFPLDFGVGQPLAPNADVFSSGCKGFSRCRDGPLQSDTCSRLVSSAAPPFSPL